MAARNRDNLLRSMVRISDSNQQSYNLAILTKLGRLPNSTLPPAALLPLIINTCNKSQLSCCTIIRLTGYGEIPAGVFKKYRRDLRPQLARLLAIEEAGSELALRTATIQLNHHFFTEAHLPSSSISVPLSFEDKPFGTITFFGKKSTAGKCRSYLDEDKKLFESMAVLIANALTCSAAFQQMSRLTLENDKQIKELSLLYRLSNTMLSTIKLNKLIHLTLTALTTPVFDRAMLFLINERSGVMQGMLGVTGKMPADLANQDAKIEDLLASRWEITEEEMNRQQDSEFNRQVMASRLELNKSLNFASQAVFNKQLIFVPRVTKNMRVDRDFIKNFGIASFAVAPLMANDRVLGVIIVDNALRGCPITQEDLRFLQLFANQAGMAIQNSILYNRIEDTNRDLREAQERLIQGERLATIGEMAAGIAHELKTPLVAIGGFAARLARKLSAQSEEWEYADLISRETLRLEKMLADILLFSKRAAICYNSCNLNEIIRDAMMVVAPAMTEKGIVVTMRFPKTPSSFLGDSQQLKQVFINLFLNAHEAMKKGGKLNVIVTFCELDDKKAICAKISDTGGGIPLEALHNIFNPFYTTKVTGTGLGLPIANRIITNHDGKIRVNNRPGDGVEFTVIIPCQP